MPKRNPKAFVHCGVMGCERFIPHENGFHAALAKEKSYLITWLMDRTFDNRPFPRNISDPHAYALMMEELNESK